jgi:hypothetical protein
VANCCECGDEPSGSCATVLVHLLTQKDSLCNCCAEICKAQQHSNLRTKILIKSFVKYESENQGLIPLIPGLLAAGPRLALGTAQHPVQKVPGSFLGGKRPRVKLGSHVHTVTRLRISVPTHVYMTWCLAKLQPYVYKQYRKNQS